MDKKKKNPRGYVRPAPPQQKLLHNSLFISPSIGRMFPGGGRGRIAKSGEPP